MMTLDDEHLVYLGLFAAGLAIALSMGGALCRSRPGRGRVDGLMLFLAPASCFIVASKTLMTLLNMTQMDWSSGRMAPAVALLRGYSIYYPVDSGPIYNTIYSPMAYLIYLPAALAGSPTDALLLGNLISHLLTLGPILFLCLAPHGEEVRNRSRVLSATVFLGFWKLTTSSVLATVPIIHADAPALGFGLLACAVLYARRRESPPSDRALLASAIFAALAVGSKQTASPLLVLLPAWALLAHGLRAFLRSCGWMAASLAATGAAYVSAFGLRPMLFNLLQIPKSHPWITPSYLKGFLLIAAEEAAVCVPVLVAILLMAYFARTRGAAGVDPAAEGRFSRWGSTLRANHWTLFAGVGLGMVPLSLATRIKFGGATGSFSPPLYYLSAAACVMLLDWHARNRERGLRHLNDALKVAVLASPFAPALLLNLELIQQVGTIHPPYRNPQEQAFRYALKHPQEAYFPWNPLSSLMAEGRAYHFEYGVFDRDLGGFPPTESHYREHLPKKLRVVAFPPNSGMRYSMQRLAGEFKHQVFIEDLPGWFCYER